MNDEIITLLNTALECSVLVSPLDPGLTHQELVEVGRKAGYLNGEINDALVYVTTSHLGVSRLLPSPQQRQSWVFIFPEEPEYRNFAAFDFVVAELNALTRSEGAAKAMIDRSILVERAISKGILHHDIQLAITWQVMSYQLTEKDGVLRFTQPNVRTLPSDQLKSHSRPHAKPYRARAYPLVKDVVERRTDSRPRYAEPFDAFGDELDNLGYKPFRLWWTQTVTELRRTDPMTAPLSASVLAAALVEGALTFVVKHAQKSGQF